MYLFRRGVAAMTYASPGLDFGALAERIFLLTDFSVQLSAFQLFLYQSRHWSLVTFYFGRDSLGLRSGDKTEAIEVCRTIGRSTPGK